MATSSNQYGGGYPSLQGGDKMAGQFIPPNPVMFAQPRTNQNAPGAVPYFGASGYNPSSPGFSPYTRDIGGGLRVGSTIDPNVTGAWLNYLLGQEGKGLTPFNLQSLLPTGGMTGAGQLSSPLSPQLQQLMTEMFTPGAGMGSLASMGLETVPGFLQSLGTYGQLSQGAQGMPGFAGAQGTYQQMAQSGMPIDQTPAWQAMVQSMQQGINQGAGQLREQMGFGGNLAGTPFGTTMANYQEQTQKDLNAQLLQAQTGALEAARQRQLAGAGGLESLAGLQAGTMATGAGGLAGLAGTSAGTQLEAGGMQGQLAQFLQGLDQQSIQNLYQEFLRTQPQYNPMLGYLGQAALTFPPYMSNQKGGGVLGAVLGGIGSALGGPLGNLMGLGGGQNLSGQSSLMGGVPMGAGG